MIGSCMCVCITSDANALVAHGPPSSLHPCRLPAIALWHNTTRQCRALLCRFGSPPVFAVPCHPCSQRSTSSSSASSMIVLGPKRARSSTEGSARGIAGGGRLETLTAHCLRRRCPELWLRHWPCTVLWTRLPRPPRLRRGFEVSKALKPLTLNPKTVKPKP